jgi:hypothetical protein
MASATLFDIDGDPYPADMPYFQPLSETLRDIDGHEWPSFAVWKSREACSRLFPNHVICEYKGDEIEEPMFVD